MNKNRPVFSKNEIGRRSHELTAPTIMKETTESEAFQWLFNNADDAVYVLDNQGKFVAVNQKVEEITELRREDYIGESFRELIPAKNLPEAMKAHKNVLQGKSTMLNTKMKKAGGNVVPVEVTLAPLEKNNKIIGTLGIIRGVTERKKVEEELRQSEKRFHDVAANTGEWIWEVDAEGRYTYSSPMVERVLGYTAEEILGEFFYDFFHTDEREQLKSAAFKVFRRREPFTNFVNQNIHKDGYIVILETSGVPIIGPGGQFLGYRGVDRDITEQKRMEEDRKHFEEKLSALNIYSQQLNMTENMEEIYELTLSAMEKTLGFEHASFLIVDGNVLSIVDQRGYLTSLSMELLLDGSKGGVTVKAAKKGKAIYVPDVRMEKAFVKTVPGIRSELAVPMKIGGKVLGILNVERKKLNAFNKRDQRLLEILASHAAIAISNFRYANNLKELIQEVEKRSSKLAALMKSSTEMMRTKDLRKRLKLIAEAIKRLGWRRVVISDRDQNLKMIDMFTAGLAPEEVKILWTKKAPGHVWRERFGP
ncbi:MAG: PAS domain S-box protein, partial [Candidatus Bathyarchaeota archaeon]|nr:PAS domain S-box protein [Candidatus Bathyarchaeota archaeon]